MRYPSPTEWLKLIEAFRESGLQQKDFVAKHNVPFNTFQYWLYRKAKPVRIESGSSPKFLPVTVVASPALKTRVGGEVLVELRDGVKIRFDVGTDTRYLAELLAALG
jgi:hypothetical protein